MRFRLHHAPFSYVGLVCLILLQLAGRVSAQTSMPLNHPGTAAGAPAGAYALTGFENVNLFNGRLNFNLPLVRVGGRGEAGYTIKLNVEAAWHVNRIYQPDTFFDNPEDYDWGANSGYSPGIMIAQAFTSYYQLPCTDVPGMTDIVNTMTRLTFKAQDGTAYELVDTNSYGAIQSVQNSCGSTLPGMGYNRGKVFVTTGGEGMTFIADANIQDFNQNAITPFYTVSGYLFMSNGTRFRIDNGYVQWMQDRNGNKITFTYEFTGLSLIQDSMGRQISICYNAPQVGNCPAFPGYDSITYKGFGGAPRTIKIWKSTLGGTFNGVPLLRADYPLPLKTMAQLFPSPEIFSTQNGDSTNNVIRTAAVEMPDGRHYKLQYNYYGELARVVLPTGGAIEYDWAGAAANGHSVHQVLSGYTPQIYRRVIKRRTYPDGSTLEGLTEFALNGSTVEHKKANGNRISLEKHYFFGNPLDAAFYSPFDVLSWPNWQLGREFKVEFFAANGTTHLRTLATTWQQGVIVGAFTHNNPRIADETTTLVDTNQVSKKVYSYDDAVPYNNVSDVYEYDYGAGVPGPLLRHTHTDYLRTHPTSGVAYDTVNFSAGAPDINATFHLRNLPTQEWVSLDLNGAIKRELTVFEYDNYSASVNFHAALQTYPRPGHSELGIIGLNPAFNSSTSNLSRGNVTKTTRHFLNTSGTSIGSISIHTQYDVAGNVVKVIDPRSTPSNIIATSVDFADSFGGPNGNARLNSSSAELNSANQFAYAFPTIATNAMGQAIYSQYDYYMGMAVDVEDVNGVVSSLSPEFDILDRPKKVIRAANKDAALRTQTLIDYDDVGRVVTTTQDKEAFGDGALVKKVFYDGLGRTTEVRQHEGGANYIAVKTEYDALGRPHKKSNPFRPLQGESELWTTTVFEGSTGPLTTTTTPDNATVTISYSGNATTVIDQTGKQRKSISDARGRLKSVYEAPDDGSFNYLTTYTYDALDNLTNVSQGAQTRTFEYDSLSRLITAITPESGTISYQHDELGNLLVKTDGRGVSVHFAYDALSRITRRWYNGSSSKTSTVNNSPQLPATVDQTDEATFYYDGQALPIEPQNYIRGASIGRLVAVTYGGSSSTTGDYFGYDSIGRNTQKTQRVGTREYQLSTTYNAIDLPISIIYPSGNSVSYSYDSAARLLSFSGNLGGLSRNYAIETTYSPFGGLTKEKFGTTTTVYNKLFYNSRGQLAEIRASTSWTGVSDTSWNRGAIVNSYSDSCVGMCGGSNSTTAMTDNNGNLKKQDIYVPNHDQIPTTNYSLRTQQYNYDKLNRLRWVRETVNSTEQWRQWYSYDQYGNRTIDTNPEPGDPNPRTWGAVNNTSFATFDLPSKNRLYAPGDEALALANRRMQYDEAGNLKVDTYTGAGSRTYDAENKMTAAQGGVPTGSQSYKYDASGQRIKRTVNGVETWVVYGFGGEMVAEYPANGVANSPQKEYGYRNGQLLITATTTAGWGAAPTIDDNPLNPPGQPKTDVKASHLTQLRSAINALRAHYSLPNYQWQKPTASGGAINNTVFISWEPIDEMRTALDQALGAPANGYAPGLTQGQNILAIHIQELRDRVLAAWTSGGSVDLRWLVTDHLGTPRIILDQSGSLAGVRRHDYLPFGEELFAGVSGRTSGEGYAADDGLRQKFTLKERDNETSLDYFHARYYSPIQGRFTSVDPYDPITLGESYGSRDYYLLQPQNWNRYTYGLNNPQKYVDPDGRNPLLTALGGAVAGAVFSGGFEAAKALYRGESLTDPKVLKRIGAKAVNGAIFGAVVGLTGNVAAGSAAVSAASAAIGSVAGGMAERALDGDPNTQALSATDIGIDALAGATGGYVGYRVTNMVGDMTYALRTGTYEAFEQLSGGPFRTLEREGLNRALNTFRYTYNVSPGFLQPEKLGAGTARGATKAGLTYGLKYVFEVIRNNLKPRDCKKGCVTLRVIELEEAK